MNFPNILSISRILLLLPIIIFFEKNLYLFSTLFFLIASITDYFDGYFARKNNQVTSLGVLLDLLADKIFVSVILIWMVFNFGNIFILLSSIFIVCREIIVSYVRLYFVSKSLDSIEVKSDIFGKIKTTFQMISLGLILISPLFNYLVYSFSITLLCLSAFFSWFSLFKYIKNWNEYQN